MATKIESAIRIAKTATDTLGGLRKIERLVALYRAQLISEAELLTSL